MKDCNISKVTSKIVAKNIGAYRFMLGLDYKQFAVRAGLTPERIRDMENGKDTLTNGVELLRIAEACNVQYTDLFEDEKTESVSARNARFPEDVWSGIFKLSKKQFKNATAFAKAIGVHPSTPGLWYKGVAHPNPFAFQNVITLLKLKSFDLEAMIKKPAPQAKPSKPINDIWELEKEEEPVTVTATLEPATTPAHKAPADEEYIDPATFESKVVKVIRFQKELPLFIAKLDEAELTIKTLRQQLAELL